MTQAGLVSAFWHFTGRVLIVETSVNYSKVSYIASHLLQPLPVFQHHGHYFWALYSNLQFICAFFSKITSVWGLSSFTWAILSFRQVHQTQSTHREVGLKTQQKQASVTESSHCQWLWDLRSCQSSEHEQRMKWDTRWWQKPLTNVAALLKHRDSGHERRKFHRISQ